MTELVSSLSALEGAQTNTRGIFEEELNKKESIIEMRTKIDKQGERLMEKIEGINKEIICIETDMRTDDSKITEFGNSINKLDEETRQIKQSIRTLKQQINAAKLQNTIRIICMDSVLFCFDNCIQWSVLTLLFQICIR